AVSEDISFSHSTLSNQNSVNTSTDSVHRAAKAFGISINPPININPSNSSLQNASITKYHKPSLKKLDFINSNMTTKLFTTTNKSYFPNKEMTVINQNSTEISLNYTDNQMLINSSFSAINHTDNFNYLNESNYNQSLLLNLEKITEKEDDMSGNLSAAGITGITLGCVVIVGVICGVSYFLYRNRGFNRPQVLNDRCSNPDSSGYIDDASVRDNSEEMYSLDNDSFLNSLEAMTIQNYWTDTVKHTKL
ncbi:uncharacterized protein BDFB_000031, partial [Asbolus verrucosus]